VSSARYKEQHTLQGNSDWFSATFKFIVPRFAEALIFRSKFGSCGAIFLQARRFSFLGARQMLAVTFQLRWDIGQNILQETGQSFSVLWTVHKISTQGLRYHEQDLQNWSSSDLDMRDQLSRLSHHCLFVNGFNVYSWVIRIISF